MVDALVTGVLVLDEAGGAVVPVNAGAAAVVDGATVEEADSPSSSPPTHTTNPRITRHDPDSRRPPATRPGDPCRAESSPPSVAGAGSPGVLITRDRKRANWKGSRAVRPGLRSLRPPSVSDFRVR